MLDDTDSSDHFWLVDVRKIVAALSVAVVLVVGLLFLLPALVSTDWVRAELGRRLSSATGMTIRLDGPVRLSLLPRLAVVADDISLSTGTGDIAISALLDVDNAVVAMVEKARDSVGCAGGSDNRARGFGERGASSRAEGCSG
ncbi:MAG: hypothetical protein E5V52_06025 [Mesorhizobium sp.]|nr:MAG: hypothetical protein E5V52_06025 [Mesorhizobium sp.]